MNKRQAAILLVASSMSAFLITKAEAQISESRRVVVLSEVGLSSPAVSSVVRDLYSTLQSKSPHPIEFHSEFLETELFPDETSQTDIRNLFIRKYTRRRPDVIIAVGPTPIKFMAGVHEKSFPGVPVVFCCSSQYQADSPPLGANFTGIWLDFDTDKTLEAALRLRPGTKHIFVVGGVSPFDQHIVAMVEKTQLNYGSKLEFTYLTNLPLESILERVRALPDESIVLFTSLLVDGAGKSFNGFSEVVRLLAQASNAPVFTLADTLVGQGAVGGHVVRYLGEGTVVGELALNILQGKVPAEIVKMESSAYIFDWRALQRWGLRESDLPPGSIVLFRAQGFWELYWRYILGGIVLLAIQGTIIAALLVQRAKRKRSEAELHETQRRFSQRLIEAQDQERTRIARELHDDIDQRLALLAVNLGRAMPNVPASAGDLAGQIEDASRQVASVGRDIQALSDRLHSRKLEILGLAATAKSYCREYSDLNVIKIDFRCEGLPEDLPREISLCLFRVLQEAIQNAIKHSGAQNLQVSLKSADNVVELIVEDSGIGFEPEKAIQDQGLGLASMRERVNLVGGELLIDSQLRCGTILQVRVPLNPRLLSARACG
ncbi:MAG TPA: ABC transporter substrate binding protein [Candidatus Acidoferrales bacterium]